MSIESDGLRERFQKWKPLPAITGKYDKFETEITKENCAFRDSYPHFRDSVMKALNEGHIGLEDIAEVIAQVYDQTMSLIDVTVFYKNEQNQYLVFQFASQYEYEGAKKFDYLGEIDEELFERFRPIVDYLGSVQEAYEFAKSYIVVNVEEIPRHYFT